MDLSSGSSEMWILAALVMSCTQLAAGFAIGYWMYSRRPSVNAAPAPAAAANPDTGLAKMYLRELDNLTARVNQEVVSHAERVEAIHHELSDAKTPDGSLSQASVDGAASQLMDANRKLQAELSAARQELNEQTQRLQSQMVEARTDPLTGLYNRRAFDEELTRRFAQFKRQNSELSLLLVDVDHFKKFNDTHGHQAGDEVLRQVAKSLAHTMRDMDVVARYGGEEFIVILPGTGLENGKRAAERARLAIQNTLVTIGDLDLNVSASLGLAQANAMDTPTMLIERADSALYAAKGAGRNCVFLHNGTECLAIIDVPVVDSESAARTGAPPKEEVIVAHCPGMIGAPIASSEDFSSRRKYERRDFSARQFLADYVDGKKPPASKFRAVRCSDVSSTGFSFVDDKLPTVNSLIVEFGVAPNMIYLTAEVVHCTPILEGEESAFKVGCKFSGRLPAFQL